MGWEPRRKGAGVNGKWEKSEGKWDSQGGGSRQEYKNYFCNIVQYLSIERQEPLRKGWELQVHMNVCFYSGCPLRYPASLQVHHSNNLKQIIQIKHPNWQEAEKLAIYKAW